MIKIKTKSKTLFLLIALAMPMLITTIFDNLSFPGMQFINAEKDSTITAADTIKATDTIKYEDELSVEGWWNKNFRYRTGIKVENTQSFERTLPVNAFITFLAGRHYNNTARLVVYNGSWSSPIPIQIWNITYFASTEFIKSCTITFMSLVAPNSNKTYFLYYNEDLTNISPKDYNTNFENILTSNDLTVTVGPSGSYYQAKFTKGLAANQLNKDSVNFHLDDSLSAEKELVSDNIYLLLHFDDTGNSQVIDSSSFENIGTMVGSTRYVSNGCIRGCVEYIANNDHITFDASTVGDGSYDYGKPLDRHHTEFTITCWIKPTELHSVQTSHGIQNVFIAKASDGSNSSGNDNLEVGISPNPSFDAGSLQIYLDTRSQYGMRTIGNDDIIVGQWNFIAIRYESINNVKVWINDNTYTTTYWYDASNRGLDYPGYNSPFCLGYSDHDSVDYYGYMDEFVMYNESISDSDIEKYALASMPSVIQKITELEKGIVFSKYLVEWSPSFDMHISDVCTFYYDYELWNIVRTIYFEDPLDPRNSKMLGLATYFNLSNFSTTYDEFKYIYDGNLVKGLSNDGFTTSNYLIVHDTLHAHDSIGLFITNFTTPNVQTTITQYEGKVVFNAGIVNYLSGYNNNYDNWNGGEGTKLIVNYWEYIDNVNQSGEFDDTAIIQYYDNLSLSLKKPFNVHIFAEEAKFYSIGVNVTDIDNNLVPGVQIDIYNNSNGALIDSVMTDENGLCVFNRLENGTYLLNATYSKYGQAPLEIAQPKIINLDYDTVDKYGFNRTSFENVGLTSLELTCQRIASGEFQEYMNGAMITFNYTTHSGSQVLGTETTDPGGNVVFRWSNFTTENEGNISFTIEWHGIADLSIAAQGDLEAQTTIVTLPFYQASSKIVNYSSSDVIEPHFELVPKNYSTMLGNSLTFEVEYYYIFNPEVENIQVNISDATVTYQIKELNGTILSAEIINFTPEGAPSGRYSKTLDSSLAIDSGGVYLDAKTYIIEVGVSKRGFPNYSLEIWFTLTDKFSSLATPSLPSKSISTNWKENFTISVFYEDTFAQPNIPISDGTVTYIISGFPSLNGTLKSTGTPGYYQITMKTTDFNNMGTYNMKITAERRNFQTKAVNITINILAIRTKINGSTLLIRDMDVFFNDSQLIWMSFTEAVSGAPIITAIAECSWDQLNSNDQVVDSGTFKLENLNNGLYLLDFNTSDLPIYRYSLKISFRANNYDDGVAGINLRIIPRVIGYFIESNEFSVISGDDLSFSIDVRDNKTLYPLEDANVYIEYLGHTKKLNEMSDGTYSLTLSKDDLPSAFWNSESFTAEIHVEKGNYSSEIIYITITVEVEEIFPGIPTYLFIILTISITAVILTFVIYHWMHKRNIPIFRKRTSKIKSLNLSENIQRTNRYHPLPR